MAYATGTASSPVDLLTKLVAWLSGTVGWNTDLSASVGAGWRAHLDLHGNFVHLRAAMNETSPAIFQSMAVTGYGMAMYTSSGFNGAVAWNLQPNTPPYQSGSSTNVAGVGMTLPSGAIQNYYFFSDAAGDNIVVVVEKTPGVFVYIGWGLSLQKSGSWTGGQYIFGSSSGYECTATSVSNPSDGYLTTSLCPGCCGDWLGIQTYSTTQNWYVRADVDSFTGKWLGQGDQQQVAGGYTGKNGTSSVPSRNASTHSEIANYGSNVTNPNYFAQKLTSQLDGRANLLPVLLWAARDVSGYSLLGSIPNVFLTNAVGNGFSNAQEYSLGATTYKLFPNFAVVKQ